jgi:S1-C subfamily serine protease
MTELASSSSCSLADLSAALVALVARAAPGIVSVHSHRARSSGFVWRPGLVVTADEALAEDGDIALVLPGGDTVVARLVGRDPTTDIALLRIDRSELPPAPPAASVSAGQLAVALGSSDGAPAAALGIVSLAGGPWRSLRGGEIDARIELDLRLARRAEGGLVLDPAGQSIGMAVFGPRRRVLVIPSATIDRVAARLETHGRIARGYLGLGLQPVALEGGGAGAMVMSVDPRGPAAAAGVHQGDVIVAWDGEAVRSVQTLLRALGPDGVGRVAVLGLRRGGEAREVRLTIAERPAA